MLVEVYLCKEHYPELKREGIVEKSSRVKGILRAFDCTVQGCKHNVDWFVTVRLQRAGHKGEHQCYCGFKWRD
jgi:DNA-directed RNA polymerase subunit M/transcription elongation factor TFIIS